MLYLSLYVSRSHSLSLCIQYIYLSIYLSIYLYMYTQYVLILNTWKYFNLMTKLFLLPLVC